jgi:Ca2+-binding RTX toxin-like protein
LILGDNGNARFNSIGILRFFTTSDFNYGGQDRIFSGAGDDMVFGGTDDDYIDGGAGDDTLIGDQVYYDINSGNPRRVTLLIETVGGHDVIFGDDGDDLILSGGGDDWIEAGAGQDTVFTGSGNNFAYGGDGNDILVGGPIGDFLDGGFGRDYLYVDVFDTWAGGMLADTIVGGPFFSTGLTTIGNELHQFGSLTAGGSAADNLARAFDRLRQGNGYELEQSDRFTLGVSNSIILDATTFESLVNHGYDIVRWGGNGTSILAIPKNELGVPYLIGIGPFIEQHWSEMLFLAN